MKERIQKLFAEQLAVQEYGLLSCWRTVSRLGDRASIKSSSKIYGLASTALSPVSSGLILKNTKMKRTPLESQLFHL